MKVGAAIAEIMKREGVDILAAYPVNHLIEHAAALDIRPIIVRQERIGLHMADAISRVTSGDKLGAFCMQHGPGHRERLRRHRAGLLASRFRSWSCPAVIRAAPRRSAPTTTRRARCAASRKSAESITTPDEVVNVMRRAMSRICATAAAGRRSSKCRRTCGTKKSPEPLELQAGGGDALAPDPDRGEG